MDNQTKAIVKYYGQIPVEFVEHKNETWVTAEAMGRALGYSDPGRAIRKILDRYSEDFDGIVSSVKMVHPSGLGGIQEVIVLSRDAVNLVGFFSKQPSAVQFRRFVLNVLREIQENGYYGEKKDLNFEALNSFRGLDGAEMLIDRAQHIIDRESEIFFTKIKRLKKKIKTAGKPSKKKRQKTLVEDTQPTPEDQMYNHFRFELNDRPQAKNVKDFKDGAVFEKNGAICFHGGYYHSAMRKYYRDLSTANFFKNLKDYGARPVEIYINGTKTRAWAIR